MFAFWAVLALEFLARAALSHVHPVLLADPQQKENIYYALGHRVGTAPQSITAKTVWSRCQDLIPRFTDREFQFCKSLMVVRNAELHSGEAAFEALTVGTWMAPYFRVCSVLLESLGKEMADLFPPEHLGAITKMLDVDEESRRSEVLETLGRAEAAFNELDESERTERLEASAHEAQRLMRADLFEVCPACGGYGWMNTEHVATSEPELVGDLVQWTETYLPTGFTCLSCRLVLGDYEALEIAGIGGQRSEAETAEPTDYFAMDSFGALMEPDYGNE